MRNLDTSTLNDVDKNKVDMDKSTSLCENIVITIIRQQAEIVKCSARKHYYISASLGSDRGVNLKMF